MHRNGSTKEAALLDALADCLAAGDAMPAALGRIALAGAVAEAWARRAGLSGRTGLSVVDALRASSILDVRERALFSAECADSAAPSLLRAAARRRRGRGARRRALAGGLVGPLGVAALTILLDPLPNLLNDGPVVWPALRGLLVLALATLALVVGVPRLLRDPKARGSALRLCAAVPGASWLAALYAEEELLDVVGPFVEGAEVSRAGLGVAATALGWSPLGDALRVAMRSGETPARRPMAGLEALARHLSLDTNLAIVGGVASSNLGERLAARGDAIRSILTARVRLLLRVGAYALVVLFSLGSLAAMVSRGLPGMPALPGMTSSPDAKQLEELMKQLEAQ